MSHLKRNPLSLEANTHTQKHSLAESQIQDRTSNSQNFSSHSKEPKQLQEINRVMFPRFRNTCLKNVWGLERTNPVYYCQIILSFQLKVILDLSLPLSFFIGNLPNKGKYKLPSRNLYFPLWLNGMLELSVEQKTV